MQVFLPVLTESQLEEILQALLDDPLDGHEGLRLYLANLTPQELGGDVNFKRNLADR